MEIVIVVGVVVVGVVGVVGLLLWIRRARSAARDTLNQLAGTPHLVDEGASCFGQTSTQGRVYAGYGCLGNADEELIFVLWSDRATLQIRHDDITAVEIVHSHLNRSKGARLLKITWEVAGHEDSVAWAVANIEAWLAALSPHAPTGPS